MSPLAPLLGARSRAVLPSHVGAAPPRPNYHCKSVHHVAGPRLCMAFSCQSGAQVLPNQRASRARLDRKAVERVAPIASRRKTARQACTAALAPRRTRAVMNSRWTCRTCASIAIMSSQRVGFPGRCAAMPTNRAKRALAGRCSSASFVRVAVLRQPMSHIRCPKLLLTPKGRPCPCLALRPLPADADIPE